LEFGKEEFGAPIAGSKRRRKIGYMFKKRPLKKDRGSFATESKNGWRQRPTGSQTQLARCHRTQRQKKTYGQGKGIRKEGGVKGRRKKYLC